METNRPTPKNIDEYIAGFPLEIQKILEQIRATIRAAAPDAQETISYGMPTFTLKGYLVYFAAYKKHIGFYPAPIGIEEFKDQIAEYEAGKGTLQFPLDKPIPYDLISKIVSFRVQANLARAEAKTK
jgi:uncharacterized protein YdhG (YjbR/CyaY superfamily)